LERTALYNQPQTAGKLRAPRPVFLADDAVVIGIFVERYYEELVLCVRVFAVNS
jgi:hypothetical protein